MMAVWQVGVKGKVFDAADARNPAQAELGRGALKAVEMHKPVRLPRF